MFILSKIRLPKSGGIVIHHREVVEKNGIKDTVDVQVTNSVNPHPDLVDKMNELKPFLAECHGLNSFVTLAKSKGLDKAQKDAFKKVLTVINNVHGTLMDKLAVTALSIKGLNEDTKDGRSVVISGTMLQENKSKTAMNSPNIKLAQDTFKFESDVQDIVNDLEKEVIAYLFEGKRAQLEIAFEDKTLEEKMETAA